MTDADFAFSEEEWAEVKAAALDVVNASLAEDDVLRASRLEDLRADLQALEDRHGSHPLLTETLADFEDDAATRIDLYNQARELAQAASLPIHTIQLSLASLLVVDLEDFAAGQAALDLCQHDVTEHGDEEEKREFAQLIATCRTHQCD